MIEAIKEEINYNRKMEDDSLDTSGFGTNRKKV